MKSDEQRVWCVRKPKNFLRPAESTWMERSDDAFDRHSYRLDLAACPAAATATAAA